MSGRDTIDNIRCLQMRLHEESDRFRRRIVIVALAVVFASWALAGWLVLS